MGGVKHHAQSTAGMAREGGEVFRHSGHSLSFPISKLGLRQDLTPTRPRRGLDEGTQVNALGRE